MDNPPAIGSKLWLAGTHSGVDWRRGRCFAHRHVHQSDPPGARLSDFGPDEANRAG
jgi:hypothetical protein